MKIPIKAFAEFAITGAMALTLLGCGKEPAPAAIHPTAPISVEEWKKLPRDIKYHDETIALLRDHDPNLKSPLAWKKFLAEVVRPEFKRDKPLPAQ